jgi:drug/metabolite transporter (DMT)-like permease
VLIGSGLCLHLESPPYCSGCLFLLLYLFWSRISSQTAGVTRLPVCFPDASVIQLKKSTVPLRAWFNTLLGVLCFSGTFPATRLALESFDPITIAFVRGTGAGVVAILYLFFSHSRLPDRVQFVRLLGASLGMVVAFPVAISIALNYVPATHASVVASVLPLMTALFGVLRGREKASVGFWVSAALGTILIALFCGYRAGFSGVDPADLLLLAGFVACSYGYAEGGVLARDLGGWRVICWALALMLPLETAGLLFQLARHGSWLIAPTPRAWGGLAYAAAISQLIGFYFYYKGLALGGVARMSQVQLLLPFAAIFAAHMALGEPVDASVLVGVAAITLVVMAGKRALG